MTARAYLASILLLLVAVALSARAQSPDFDSYHVNEIPLDSGLDDPQRIAVADFDDDGLVDVVVAIDIWNAPRKILVMRGEGDGTFSPHSEAPILGIPADVNVADFDADGSLDLAIVCNGSDGATVLMNDGAANFTPTDYLLGENMQTVTSGDFDEDGHLDLATGQAFRGKLWMMFGDGLGGFTVDGPSEIDGIPFSFGSGDIDEDGHLDLVVGATGEAVSWYRGDGNGSFTLAGAATTGFQPKGLSVVDIDEDGHLDLAFTIIGPTNSIEVFSGDGNGAFTLLASLPLQVRPEANLIVADLDADGDLDLLAPDNFDFVIYPATSPGQFGAARRIEFGQDSPHIQVGDADEDGYLDILALNLVSHVMCLPGDGELGFRSIRKIEDSTFSRAGEFVDVDADGNTDVLFLTQPGGLALHLGDGTADLAPMQEFAAGGNPFGLAIGDFDENGTIDAAVTNELSDSLSILLGDGAGSFSELAEIALSDSPRGIVAADFDEDDHLDLALVLRTAPSGAVLLYFGDGSGQFVAGTPIATDGWSLEAIATADLNHDDHADLVFSSNSAGGRVSVLLGDGAGGFSPEVRHSFPSGSLSQVELVDLDEDTHVDVIVSGNDFVDVLYGDGTGSFSTEERIGDGDAFAIGAFDDDPALDIAMTKHPVGGLTIYVGDGARGFTPTGTFGVHGLQGAPSAGDLDGDGLDELFAPQFGTQIARNATLDRISCRVGTVGTGVSTPEDVLSVNQSTGTGDERRVLVDSTGPLEIFVDAPPSVSPAPYALYAFLSEPRASTVEPLSFGLGSFCFSPPWKPHGRPSIKRSWNNIGKFGLLGQPDFVSSPAPSVALDLSQLGIAATFTLQGFIRDTDAPNGKGAVTNAIVVESF